MATNLQDWLDQDLELFFGQATESLCHVYARVPRRPELVGVTISGMLRGPSCLYAHTLPANYTFNDLGPGESHLALAKVPEPCFWTPDLPHFYEASVQLRRAGDLLASCQRMFGIRRLGTDRRSLIFDAKRWVLRAVCRDELPRVELPPWHQAGAAMLVDSPHDDLCQEASRVGVMLLAMLDGTSDSAIRRLGRWPAVCAVALPAAINFHPAASTPNLLLGQFFAPDETLTPAPWASFVCCQVDDAERFLQRTTPCKVPVIAIRKAGRETLADVQAGRALCDRLQAELAGQGDFAGYVV